MASIKPFVPGKLIKMFQKVFRGSAYLLVAQSIIKLISFFYTIYLLSQLSPNNFGLYVVALSYFSLISSLADFGVNRYLIREVAVDKASLNNLMMNVLALRLTVTSALFGSLALIFFLFDPNSLRSELISLGLIATIPQAIAITLDSVYIGLQKFSYSAFGVLFLSIVTTCLGLIFVSRGLGVRGATLALVLGEIGYALFACYLFTKIHRLHFVPIKLSLIKGIVRGSLPYGILSLLGFLYFKVDALILNYMKGDYATGIYGAAYKFLEAATFVPSSLSSVIFPLIARLSFTNPKKIYGIYLRISALYLVLSLIIMVLFLTVLPVVITHFLPQYLTSIGVIKILTLTMPFLFMIAPQTVVLLSHQKYLKTLIYFSIFNLALNIVLNVLLIPNFTYYGSAAVTVISDIVGFLIYSIYIFKTRLLPYKTVKLS